MDEFSHLYDTMKDVVVIVMSKPPEKKEGEEAIEEEEEEEEEEGEEEEEEEGEEEEEDGIEYGAGVVINKFGYILTCAHLVPNGSEISVRRSGDDYFQEAEVFLLKPELDLAILRTEEVRAHPYTFCKFGDMESLYIGMRLCAITHPDKINYSFVMGDVAYLERLVGDIPVDYYKAPIPDTSTVIQINNMHGMDGSHGAPVFDSNGEVFGLIAFSHGFDFAIPTGPLKEMVKLGRKKLREERK